MASAGLGFEVLGGGLRSSRAPGRRRPGWCRALRPGCRPGGSRVPRDGSRRSARGAAGRVIYPDYVSLRAAGLLSARVSTTCKSRAHGLEPCEPAAGGVFGSWGRRGWWVAPRGGGRYAGGPGRGPGRGWAPRARTRRTHVCTLFSTTRAKFLGYKLLWRGLLRWVL